MMFEDIVALVTSVDPLDADGERLKVDIETQLESFGARIVKRICKSISHVILLMDEKCTLKKIENPRKRISSLLERIEKVGSFRYMEIGIWKVLHVLRMDQRARDVQNLIHFFFPK